MTRVLWSLFFAFTGFAGEPPKADHLILISVDGFRPDFYRDSGWPAPNLQQMAAGGVSADGVRGVFPSVTYPSHTTMITGAKPRRHGILYNSPFEEGGQTGAWYWYASAIKTRTLWHAAEDKNMVTASLSWPVSVKAPVDYNLPEYWPLDDSDLFDLVRNHIQPKGFAAELEREALGRLNNDTFNTWSLMRDIRLGLAASYLIRTYKPHLMTLHLVRTDFAQHEQGREGPDVRRAVANADVAIGLIRESLKAAGIEERSAIIVTGDHGFVNIDKMLAPNVWLVKAGLRGAEKDRGDWKANWHKTGASAFLILKDPGDTATVAKVRKLLEDLPADRKKLFRVLEADELAAMGAPDVPLALSPAPGVNFSGNTTGDDLYSTKGGQHGYVPDFDQIYTGFIGYGSGFKEGIRVKRIGLEDIAPMAAHLLGLEMEAPDGKLHAEFFK
ncbi:MAG: ectonucleotide pyrophosphatase/phosphodiesterase [Acidobacteriota bacterium]|nr:ectonucleotide pyrophosphatase/phosphodiesterase [Acidobacteriota bacterium]